MESQQTVVKVITRRKCIEVLPQRVVMSNDIAATTRTNLFILFLALCTIVPRTVSTD
jgi:hypothetical protein